MKGNEKMASSNSYRLILDGISPLFIGSGELYSQLDYIHHEDTIFIIDFDKLLEQIPTEVIDDLTNEISENFKNNIWEGNIREFLGRYNINWREIIEKKYELIGTIGKNEINQFIKTGDQIYIPGSSLKGAIRTAILFKILEDNPNKKENLVEGIVEQFNDRQISKLIQKDGSTDLLRALIISDSKISENSPIKIASSTVYHLRNKEPTIPIYYEILDEGFGSIGTIKINDKLVDSNALISNNFHLTSENIINAINSFSKEIITYELEELSARADSNLKNIIDFYKELKAQLENLNDNECIFRLGQGSSILGITLFLNFKDNKQIARKYKGLEMIRFNIPDRYNKRLGIARIGRYTILPDRNSPHRPNLNEYWLCSTVSTRGNNKYVNLIEKVEKSLSFDLEQEKRLLFPLTRKFIVSNDKLISPFGWIKMRWEQTTAT